MLSDLEWDVRLTVNYIEYRVSKITQTSTVFMTIRSSGKIRLVLCTRPAVCIVIRSLYDQPCVILMHFLTMHTAGGHAKQH